MIITTLEIYKGDTYCLIADGDKRIYINKEIKEKFSLCEGMEIDRDTFTRIMYSSELRKASRRAMYLINEREYSYRQLFEKLKNNYPEDICFKVCDLMAKKGYVNDRRFAKALVYNYMNCKLYGPRRVRDELYRRGIKGRTADEAIEEAMEGLEERLLTLIERKYAHRLLDPQDRKNTDKVKNALLRAGYEYGDIDRAVKEYIYREQEI